MSQNTAVAQRDAYAVGTPAPLPLNLTPPEAVVAHPVVAVQRPPSAFRRTLDAYLESSHGKALGIFASKMGAVAGAVAPIALTAGGGYLVGTMHATSASTETGVILGAFAGLLSVPTQYDAPLIKSYKHAGHPHPLWASFRDVMVYMTLPATAVGLAVSASLHGAWGVGAAVVTGLLGTFLGLTAADLRLKAPAPVSVPAKRAAEREPS